MMRSTSFGIVALSLGTAHGLTLNPPECVEKKTTPDNNALYECARFNTDGHPFGHTVKQMEHVELCSGSEEDLQDLKLSITNKLFGGEGDDMLTADDCKASCVYSMKNADINEQAKRVVSGISLPDEYVAYHFNKDGECWNPVKADWCLNEVELPRYWGFTAETALTWRFPAFKVQNFCGPQVPTAKPTQITEDDSTGAQEDDATLPGSSIPAGCVVQDNYNCPQRFLLGFCNMSEAVRSSFVAQCPGCCATDDASGQELKAPEPSSNDAGSDAAAAP